MKIREICAPLIFAFATVFLSSCIGDDIVEDIVEPTLRITNPLLEMEIGTEYEFEYVYFNSSGEEESVEVGWITSDPTVMSVNNGLATAIGYGDVTMSIQTVVGEFVETSISFSVTDETIAQPQRTGSLVTTSSYTLQGDFVLSQEQDGLRLTLMSNYLASSSLPGLEVYLTNNPNTTNGAYELGPVSVFSGSHFYDIPQNVDLFEYSHVLYYCAPFNVKVGDGVFLD